jgi:hypothetical protein
MAEVLDEDYQKVAAKHQQQQQQQQQNVSTSSSNTTTTTTKVTAAEAYLLKLESKRTASQWPQHGGKECPTPWSWIVQFSLRQPQQQPNKQQQFFDASYYKNLDVTVNLWKAWKQSIEFRNSNNNDHNHFSTNANRLQFQLLNYHAPESNSITTTMYCELTDPETGQLLFPHTCYDSRHRYHPPHSSEDVVAVTNTTSLSNGGGTDMPLIQQKQQQQQQQEPQNHDHRRHHNKGSLSPFDYDLIVVRAANLGLIDTQQMTRQEARNHLTWYHSGLLNKTRLDLPLKCPTRDRLERFLAKSLALEDLVMNDLAVGTMNRLQEQLKKEDHIASFWKSALNDKVYCWVDTDRLFEKAGSWDEVLKVRLNRTWTNK